METKELGRFYAIAFDETIYEFIVYNDYMICPTISNEKIKRIVLKPRFDLIEYGKGALWMPVAAGYTKGLIKTYDIDDELFNYLREKNMIMYSIDMAYLYGFKDKSGYDRQYNKTPFKRVKDKEKILIKQKQGKFN